MAAVARPPSIKADPGWYWVRRIASLKHGVLVPCNWETPFIPSMFTETGTFHYLDLCSFDGMHPDEFELGPRIEAPPGMQYNGKGYMRAVYAK